MDKYCVLCMASAMANESVTSRTILKITVNSKSQRWKNVSGIIFFYIVCTIIKAKKFDELNGSLKMLTKYN